MDDEQASIRGPNVDTLTVAINQTSAAATLDLGYTADGLLRQSACCVH